MQQINVLLVEFVCVCVCVFVCVCPLVQPSWLWCRYYGIMSVSCLADMSALPAVILQVQNTEGKRSFCLPAAHSASHRVGGPFRFSGAAAGFCRFGAFALRAALNG